MKKKLALLLGFYSILSFSQIKIDYNHDLKGNPIEEEYHTFLQSEHPSVEIKIDGGCYNYEKGFYVDLDKKKHEGYIKVFHKKFKFKKDGSDINETSKLIPASEIEYLKLGIDSFFVAKKVYDRKELLRKPLLVKYIATYGDNQYGRVYEFNGINHLLTDKYMVIKTPNIDAWRTLRFKSKKHFKEMVLFYFKGVPFLEEKIKDKSIEKTDFLDALKIADFYEKYRKEEPLYYNDKWQELLSANEERYRAEIVSLKDTIWTVNYYEGVNKIYEVDLSSVSPNIKSGEFKIFNKKGIVLEERTYSNDSIIEAKKYDFNGKILTHYKNVAILEEGTKKIGGIGKSNTDLFQDNEWDKILKKKHIIVNDSLGNGQLDEEGNGIFEDNKNGVKHEFVNNEKIRSFYVENDKTTTYNKAPYPEVKLIKFKETLSKYLLKDIRFKKIRTERSLEGTYLISIDIGVDGSVHSYEFLNELDVELDEILISFFKEKITPVDKKPFKFYGFSDIVDTDYIKFLLPITFSHNRFEPLYNRIDNNLWFNNWMFQQQLMQQPRISVPRF